MGKKRKPVERESTVADAVSEAFGTLEELGGEMREAFDNTPESLQASAVGEARNEAADMLENLSEPSVNDAVGALKVTLVLFALPRRASRSDRRDEATQILHQVVDVLDNVDDGMADEVSGLRDEVENLISEAEGVEFPGMYG